MKDSLSLKQYQLISAYIDGRCSPREKAQVESLLKSNDEFTLAVAEFSRCKNMFSALPRVRAPRNFTLSPSQVPGKPPRFFPVSVLNYAALTAAVLCVVLFAGSYLFPLETMQKSAASAPMLAAVSDQSGTTATPVPLILWQGDEANAKGGGGGIGGGPVGALNSVEGGAPSTNPAPLETEVPLAESYMSATAEPTQSPEPYGVAAASDTSNVILGIASTDEQGKELTQEPAPVSTRSITVHSISWVKVTEIGLAVVAVVSALIALILRKRR